jgi:hypothetical protein
MIISHIRWTPDRVRHIARHNITPDEVEEAAFDDPGSIVQKLKRTVSDLLLKKRRKSWASAIPP